MRAAAALLAALIFAALPAAAAGQDAAPRPDARGLVQQGVQLLQQGRPDQAESYLRRAVTAAPSDALAWGALGQDLLALRRPEEAAPAFEKALVLDDAAPSLGRVQRREAFDGLGLALAFQRRFDRARETYGRAMAWDPDFYGFPYNLACVCALAGDREGALRALDAFLKRARALPPGATVLDAALDDDLKGLRGDPRFEGLLAESTGAQPDDTAVSGLVRRGAGMLGRGDAAGAAELLQGAAARDPADARAHFFLGGALEALGRRGEAAAAYRRALELNKPPRTVLGKPCERRAALACGEALLAAGKAAEAVPFLETARDRDLYHPAALYALARAKADLGDASGALAVLRKALELSENLTPVEPPLPAPASDPLFQRFKADPLWAPVLGDSPRN